MNESAHFFTTILTFFLTLKVFFLAIILVAFLELVLLDFLSLMDATCSMPEVAIIKSDSYKNIESLKTICVQVIVFFVLFTMKQLTFGFGKLHEVEGVSKRNIK